jgi:hypothetical protein
VALTSPDNLFMNTVTLGPKLQKRLRAFLLAQKAGYGKLQKFLDLQRRSLEVGQYDVFILRNNAEEQIMAELTALDKVIRPLEEQLNLLADSGFQSDPGLPNEPSLPELRRIVESARRSALEANGLCVTLLSEVTRQLKDGLPTRKRVPRFAGGDPGRPPRFIDISA